MDIIRVVETQPGNIIRDALDNDKMEVIQRIYEEFTEGKPIDSILIRQNVIEIERILNEELGLVFVSENGRLRKIITHPSIGKFKNIVFIIEANNWGEENNERKLA